MNDRPVLLMEFARVGALEGLYVWSVYAAVECAFSTLLTRSITPSLAYAPLHPGLLALLFVLYPLLGACLSAAGAVLLAVHRGFPVLYEDKLGFLFFLVLPPLFPKVARAVNTVIIDQALIRGRNMGGQKGRKIGNRITPGLLRG